MEQEQNRKKLLQEFMSDRNYVPMRLREIAGILQVPRTERESLNRLMNELVSEGIAAADEKGRISLAEKSLQCGVFSGTSRGFGFVETEKDGVDIFIPESGKNNAMDGDKVQFEIIKEAEDGQRKEGRILKIIEHNNKYFVGTFIKQNKSFFVRPDNQKFGADIRISKEHTKGAVDGHKVYAEITHYATMTKNAEGKVIEILGHSNDPRVDTIVTLRAFGLSPDFSEEVLTQVSGAPEQVSEKECIGREDFRDLLCVTIDGEDAKDLDDAITLEKTNTGYRLGVHIADVTHYVPENSPLDTEALRRGTSVYLIDRVVPMLPHRLSNGICSLNEGCDRLALSCIMEIDSEGNVTGHKLCESVLRVTRRMSYTQVQQILDVMNAYAEEEKKQNSDVMTVKDSMQKITDEYGNLVPMFLQMEELSGILRLRRKKRGAIDFDFPESKVTLSEDGSPIQIAPYEHNRAMELIEDFMLLANETVAEEYFWNELPFLYRIHEAPDADKMKQLNLFVLNFGYSVKMPKEVVHPKELQKLLESVEGSEEAPLISRLTLRSMKQAKYSPDCVGHFGLAAKYYCHFTSPIRRYPDLQIHRIIKENLHGKLTKERIRHYRKILEEVASQTSKTERTAEEAEREIIKAKKAEYMEQFIGEQFEGVISGLTNWGMFVELHNTVEGMVRLSELRDDYYIFDEEHYLLQGEHSKNIYRLGQKITVTVTGTDRIMKTVNFLPV